MNDFTSVQKEEIRAQIAVFKYSGFRVRLCGNITQYCGSFIGRDFKAWTQMALFIITLYLTEEETAVWVNLSKVHATCPSFSKVPMTLQSALLIYIHVHQVFQLFYCSFYLPKKRGRMGSHMQQMCPLIALCAPKIQAQNTCCST